MDELGVRRLRAAIIIQAAVDYRNAVRFFARHGRRINCTKAARMDRQWKECERFFRSEWFDALNPMKHMSGEEMLTYLQTHAIDMGRIAKRNPVHKGEYEAV